MRSENLYALERMECQEVSIATDDMCSVATHGQFKKLVVLSFDLALHRARQAPRRKAILSLC